MKVIVRGKNKFEPGVNISDYANKGLEKLKKYFKKSDEITAHVLCKSYDKHKTVEITIPTKHIILRSEVNANTIYEAMDLAIERIEKQFIKHKDKITTAIKKREGVSEHYFNEVHKSEKPDKLSELVKAKQIDVEEMDREDALTQMEMLDHDFFLFVDSKTHRPCVVYIRKDGNYGIIETK